MSRNLARARQLHTQSIPKAKAALDKATRDRDAAVAQANAEGLSYRTIADELGVSSSYIQVIVQRSNGQLPPSRRRI